MGMPGRIEVIAGGMYSGKTEELIRRLRRAAYAKQNVILFKPEIDDRYSEENVVSHVGDSHPAIPIQSISTLEEQAMSPDVDVVGIDEAQFLPDLVAVCQRLANSGKRVVVAGLDMDWKGQPFGEMPVLMAIAESVTKLLAICVQCGADAGFSYKMSGSKQQVEVGGVEIYEARCRDCFHE
jgi:thymidine kinase